MTIATKENRDGTEFAASVPNLSLKRIPQSYAFRACLRTPALSMSNQTSILWPVFALAAWTLLILLLVAFRRLSATFTGKTSPNAYALGESAKVPLAAVLANRNYMNLLELPLLFYVGCLTAYVTGGASLSMLALSWSYVALRVVHSLIHVSYNHIMHRFAAFSASNFALVIFWVLLAGKVMQT